NAFGLLRFGAGVVGQFHVSMTEWRESFCIELQGELGSISLERVAGNDEALTVTRRPESGSAPSIEKQLIESGDASWAAEWADFAAAMHGRALEHGTPEDGLQIIATIDALY